MRNSAAKQQSAQQYSNDMAAAEIQRTWNVEDRDEERAYDRAQLDESRIYNRQELNEARTYDEKRIRDLIPNMVTDAEKAGFNPLTLLRSGGASSYGAGSGFAPLSSGSLTSSVTRRQAPVRQAVGGSPMADGIEGAANAFIQNFDPHRDTMREAEVGLINAQIRNLNMQSETYAGRTFEGPVRSAGRIASSTNAGKLGAVSVPEVGPTNVTNPWSWGTVDPDKRDAAAFEERYGEIGGSIIGGGILVNDIVRRYSPRINPSSSYIRKGPKGGGGW